MTMLNYLHLNNLKKMLNIVIVVDQMCKSTLFNRLAKKYIYCFRGYWYYRDYREFETSIADLKFKITDLAGFEFNFKDELINSINDMIYEQIENLI